jgi:hypothetical protein
MLFGHPPFDITFYRGPDYVGMFQPIPGYALTRTWERTPTPGSKTVAIKLNATDIEIPVFWQVGDLELGSYDCGPLVGYIVKGQIIPPKGATFSPITIDAVTRAGTITVGDKTINVCPAGKPVGLVSYRSGDTVPTVAWGGSTLRITEVSPPPSIWYDDGQDRTAQTTPTGNTSQYWLNWVKQAIDPLTGKPVNVNTGDQLTDTGSRPRHTVHGLRQTIRRTPRETTSHSMEQRPRQQGPQTVHQDVRVPERLSTDNRLQRQSTARSILPAHRRPDRQVSRMELRRTRRQNSTDADKEARRSLHTESNIPRHGTQRRPTWPVNSFAKWPIAYDSREDETTQETQKPDIPIGFTYTSEAGPWPTGGGWSDPTVCR